MAGINRSIIVVPEFTNLEEARQVVAKALNDLQDRILSQLPITNMQGKRLSNVGNPESPDDVVTVQYLQNLINNLTPPLK